MIQYLSLQRYTDSLHFGIFSGVRLILDYMSSMGLRNLDRLGSEWGWHQSPGFWRGVVYIRDSPLLLSTPFFNSFALQSIARYGLRLQRGSTTLIASCTYL